MRHVQTLALAGLIVGSLVFSVGGVAIVGRAGDSNPSVAPAAGAPDPSAELPKLPADAKAKQECTPPQRHEVRARIPNSDPSHTVVLNTRGYNYPMPNEVRPIAPPRKDALPAPPEQP